MRKDLVIIRVDGGIASQIDFVALGLEFESRGYKVKYDLSWFDECGNGFYNEQKGYDRSYNIAFDIPKAFPDIKCEIANRDENEIYRKKYFVDNEEVIELKPPLYVGGYLGRHFHFKYRDFFAKHFNPKEIQESDSESKILLDNILSNHSCGVHIRRGDLSKEHVVYGKPLSVEYFLKNIQLVLQIEPKSKFYFFSDDLEWVKKNVIPSLNSIEYEICNVNSVEKGYLDLYLLSRCKIIIASHGSMGKYAKMLALDSKTLLITLNKNAPMENVMMVNWANSYESFEEKYEEKYEEKQIQKPLSWRNKIRLKIYTKFRNKLLQKGIL